MTEVAPLSSSASQPAAPPIEPLALAQKALAFNENTDDPFSLLSTAPGLPPVTIDTPVADLRSNYRKLAALIHPDRIKKVFEQATEAFQRLVRVFENVNDPQYRAKLVAASKKPSAAAATQKKSAAAGKQAKKEKTPKEEKKKAPKKAASAKKSKDDSDSESSQDSDSSDDSSDSSDTSDEDEDANVGSAKAAKKKVSGVQSKAPAVADEFGMKAREARDNTGCYRTPVACPNCQEVWQPDDARHYTLLMCYGVRVFCSTCFLQFGPAAALHFCPCCKAPANYDISMFDTKVTCGNKPKCGKTYGFSSVAVTDKHLEGVREKMRAEAAKRQRDEERAQRAAARSGGGAGGGAAASSSAVSGVDEAQLEDNVGQCMVTGSCPVCDKRVGMRAARAHVTECMANPPKKKRATACVIIGEAAERKREAAAKKKAAAAKKKKATASTGLASKKAAPKKAAAKKSKAKKRSRDSDSDDSD